MNEGADLHAYASYIVRVSRDESGQLRGVVVQVHTGQRLPFSDVNGVGPLLRTLIETDLGAQVRPSSDDPAADRQPLRGS